MRILFVTGSLMHGGAERHTVALANRLAERGHACHFAYLKNEPSQLGRLRLGAASGNAGSVECLHAQGYLDSGAAFRLKNYFVRTQPTVAFAVNPYGLMYSTLAVRWAGMRIPLVTAFHSTLYRNVKERLQMLLYRPFFWMADRAVFVCEAQRRHWRRRQVFGRRDQVIYNGVDLEHWKPFGADERRGVRGALGIAADDYIIGLSAVLRPEKNPVQLVEAVAMLRRRGIPARALMIGDGPLRAGVEARARALGLAKDVLISGFQQDVRPFLAACDVAVLTSFTEAFSLAAIEAMALGLPVVHSEVGGAAEMIRPGRNGFLFPAGDTAALAERLTRLAARPTRERMGARAREAVEARFSERAMIDAYEKMLLELETTGNGHENLRRTAGAH